MQNQPGSGAHKHDPGDAVHDRQAARTSEDAFKGGGKGRVHKTLSWLRNPWKPAASHLWPEADRRDES